MNKLDWMKTRIILISLLIFFVLVVAIKSVISTTNSHDYQPLTTKFPDEIVVSQWTLISSQILPAELPKYQNGHEYKYKNKNENNQQSIIIEVRNEPYTDGNVSRLISVYQNIKPATINWQVKSSKNGFYAIFDYENKFNITACLKNDGSTTVTEQQFYSKSLFNYFNPLRLLNWLMGISPLTDSECHFILLSADNPVQSDQSDYNSFKVVELENLWQQWIDEFIHFLG